MGLERLRIFISSPGDVAEERVLANNLVRRLSDEYADRLWIEPVFWEHEPLLATSTFQKQIPPPRDCEVVVCILWSRLGTRLPADIKRKDGSLFASGTEFEFEDAADSFRATGHPQLLVYRKKADPVVSLKDIKAARDRLSQKEALDAFIRKWFIDETDGTLKAASHGFMTTADFETLLEEHLRKIIERRMPAATTAAPPVKPSWTKGSPFRGLDVFDFEHAPIFFGRTQAIGDVLNALRQNTATGRAFVLVVGVSGGGKSSLVRAGVLPVLIQPGVIEGVGLWRRALLKPSDAGGDLLRSLASALLAPIALPELGSDGTTPAQLATLLRQTPAAAFALIKGGLSQAAATLAREQNFPQQPEARLAVVVDQLEELFTLPNVTPEDCKTFIDVLSSLARSGKVCVIATLRGDFYHRCFELPELVALQEGSGQYALPLPASVEIAQMIRQPARAASLTFEEDPITKAPLDDVVREAASSSPESLPLLEFALEELYQRRTPAGVLSYAAYKDLGGVEGALARRAEAVFAALSPTVQACLPRVMRGLVSIGPSSTSTSLGTGTATRQQAALASVAPTVEAKAFAEAFVQARLFTADRMEDGTAVVRVTHEALLGNWPRVIQWLEQDRELLIVRARVSAAAARWEREGRRSDLLLGEGKPLAEAEALATTLGDELPAVDYALIAASKARRQRVRRVRRVAVAALILLTIAAGAAATVAQRQRKIAAQNAQRALDGERQARENERQANQARLLAVHLAGKNAKLAADLSHTLSETDARIGHLLMEQGRDGEALPYEARALKEDESNQAAVTDSVAMLYRYRSPRLLFRHDGPVHCAAFSPDGTRVVTASADNTARVWDAATGKPLGKPMQHKGEVNSAAFSPDGKWVVTTSEDHTAQVWDAATGDPVGEPMHYLNVTSAAFSPDGTRVVTASGDHAAPQMYDAATGKLLSQLLLYEGHVNSATFSPDGMRVVTASGEFLRVGGEARVWDAAMGKPLGKPMRHEKEVTSAAFSPDGARVVTASQDRTAQVWDSATGNPLGKPMQHQSFVNSAAFSSDGTRVVTASWDKTARVWDAATGKPLGEPMPHAGTVLSATFSPDGARVVTVSEDHTARVWDAATNKPLGGPMRHEDTVRTAAFSRDGMRVVTASDDHTARVWDAVTGKPLGEPMRHGNEMNSAGITNEARANHAFRPIRTENQVNSAVFSRDGTRVVTASNDNTAQVWDAATSKPLGAPMRHDDWVNSAAFSPDGTRVVTASFDGTARVWDAAKGKPQGKPMVHKTRVYSAVFNLDGTRVFTISHDEMARLWVGAPGEVRVWNAVTCMPLGEPMSHENWGDFAAFSSDGTQVVTANDTTAQVWDAATGKPLGDPMRHEKKVNSAAFSRDGTRVVTASGNTEGGEARVWEAVTGKPLGNPMLHEQSVESAAFSPDGTRVVTASRDETARVWDAVTGTPVGEPMRRHSSSVTYDAYFAAFNSDGTRVVTASHDGTARLWDLAVPAPSRSDFLAQLDQLTADRRLAPGGFAEPLPDWMASHDSLKRQAESASATQPSARWMSWFLADPLHRTISPFSQLTFADWISNRLEENTADGIRDVWEVDPNNARCLARLARSVILDIPEPYSASVPIYVELYSRRAVELAKDDPDVLWRRAAMLAWLGRRAEAEQLADRSPSPPSNDLWAWEAKWEACVMLKRDADADASLATAQDLAKARPKFVRDSLEQNMKEFKTLPPRPPTTQPATSPLNSDRP